MLAFNPASILNHIPALKGIYRLNWAVTCLGACL
jgi:hypothetical protein